MLLMIPNEEGCYYLAVRQLSASSKRITPKRKCDFCSPKCLHSCRIKKT